MDHGTETQLLESEVALTIIDWLADHVPQLVIKYANQMKPDLLSNLKEWSANHYGVDHIGVMNGQMFIRLKDGREQRFDNLQGKDGISITHAAIDDEGMLRLTFEHEGEQEVRQFGPIVGKDGRGIQATLLNDDGHLLLQFDDGKVEDLGNVRGRDGNRIERCDLNGEFLDITVLEPDGTESRHRVGPVRGKDGRDGQDGTNGKDGARGPTGKRGEPGRSIQQATINERGHLVLLYDDGVEHDTGNVKGNLVRARISRKGDLKLLLDNNQEINAGTVRAQNGQDGAGFLWRGPFNGAFEYHGQLDNPIGPIADVVSYEGSMYVATGRIVGIPPPSGTWQLMIRGTEESSNDVVRSVIANLELRLLTLEKELSILRAGSELR